MALAALSSLRKAAKRDDDDVYTFSDDQRQAYFDLQSLSQTKYKENGTTDASSAAPKRTLRPRQQFSADSAAPNNSSSNNATPRSSSFPPLFGSLFSSSNSKSNSVTDPLRPSSNSGNSFSTRDVRSGLVTSPEDNEPTYAEFYDVDYGSHDEEIEEEYFDDYYGERTYINLQERLREINHAFETDSTPVERISTTKGRRVKFNEEVSVFCPSLDGDDDENDEGLYSTKELEPGASSNNQSVDNRVSDQQSQQQTKGSMDDGRVGRSDDTRRPSDVSADETGGAGRGGCVGNDLVIRDLEAEIFPPHCELGEGEYSHALRNGTALTNPHNHQLYSSDIEFSSLSSNYSENSSHPSDNPQAANLSNHISNAPEANSTLSNDVNNKIVIDLTLKPDEPPEGDITANPFFSKPVQAQELQDKLSELCIEPVPEDQPPSETQISSGEQQHQKHIHGSLKDYEGFSMDAEDRELAALTSKPIITEIMEKVAISNDGSSEDTNKKGGSESGSLNDSSDSLVIPTDTGSDTSSDITAVMKSDVGGVGDSDKSRDGEEGQDVEKPPPVVPKRQRPTSARIRPRSVTSVTSTVVASEPLEENAEKEEEETATLEEEGTTKSVKFIPATADNRRDNEHVTPHQSPPAKKPSPPSSSRKTGTNHHKTTPTKSSPTKDDTASPPQAPQESLPALRRPKSAATLTSRKNANNKARSSSASRSVTSESIQHLRFDHNHPVAAGLDSNGQPLSPRSGRQPLAWQYAKLPTYDGAKSPYGLSSKQLEDRERLKRELAEKRRKENEDKINAELEKRRQRDINFQLWLRRKKEERSSDSGMSSESSSASAGGPGRPGSVSPVKSRRLPLRAKDPAVAEESFKAWMERKKEEEKIEKRRAELKMLASTTNSRLHSKEDCDLAFQQWMKRKNAERRAEEASRGHIYRSMSLDRLLKHAQTLKSAYMAYFGPDF